MQHMLAIKYLQIEIKRWRMEICSTSRKRMTALKPLLGFVVDDSEICHKGDARLFIKNHLFED